MSAAPHSKSSPYNAFHSERKMSRSSPWNFCSSGVYFFSLFLVAEASAFGNLISSFSSISLSSIIGGCGGNATLCTFFVLLCVLFCATLCTKSVHFVYFFCTLCGTSVVLLCGTFLAMFSSAFRTPFFDIPHLSARSSRVHGLSHALMSASTIASYPESPQSFTHSFGIFQKACFIIKGIIPLPCFF